MKVLVTPEARGDIRTAVRESDRLFGLSQAKIYGALIRKAIAMVAEQPERPGSISLADVRPGVRMFHLELAAGRLGAASHCLFYRLGRMPDGSTGVVVLRVLHHRKDPAQRLT